jgi:hypothetical protein
MTGHTDLSRSTENFGRNLTSEHITRHWRSL